MLFLETDGRSHRRRRVCRTASSPASRSRRPDRGQVGAEEPQCRLSSHSLKQFLGERGQTAPRTDCHLPSSTRIRANRRVGSRFPHGVRLRSDSVCVRLLRGISPVASGRPLYIAVCGSRRVCAGRWTVTTGRDGSGASAPADRRARPRGSRHDCCPRQLLSTPVLLSAVRPLVRARPSVREHRRGRPREPSLSIRR